MSQLGALIIQLNVPIKIFKYHPNRLTAIREERFH